MTAPCGGAGGVSWRRKLGLGEGGAVVAWHRCASASRHGAVWRGAARLARHVDHIDEQLRLVLGHRLQVVRR